MQRLRRIPAVVFAGDARVWRAALCAFVPLAALLAYYCLTPRDYYTGTNSVEVLTYIAPAQPQQLLCVPDVHIPAGTARIRLQAISRTSVRPAMVMTLKPSGGGRALESRLAATTVSPTRISNVDFPLAEVPRAAQRSASICITAGDLVNWGGTPLPAPPLDAPPTLGGAPVVGRIALWYLPRAGAQQSYLARTGAILRRASLFRPGIVGPWLYALILLVCLPGIALLAVRLLAVASASGTQLSRPAMAASLFAIAAINFSCWAFITPAFQAPDEVDHFAYTQSLVERGQAPSRNPGAPLARWSGSEAVVLERMSFFTDHQIGDTSMPWSSSQQASYRSLVRATHPRSSDGGGNETAATHGAIYYAALAPAYMLASSSPLDELTLMRLTSALIGALTVLFAFLLVLELAPTRPWVAVLASLLIAYQPMYGFISGAVNNDVGVNAGAAALELLLILLLRRGPTLVLGFLTGALLLVLPIVKGTAYSMYPVAGVALLLAVWRHHRRFDAYGFTALAAAALAVRLLSSRLNGVFRSPGLSGGTAAGGVGVATGTISVVIAHPLGYLGYLWEVFLPRLSFMAPHFETASPPAFVIFVERGWGAFGWYDVFFAHWVYRVIFAAMLVVPLLGLVAARREWSFVRRNLAEAVVLLLTPIAVVAGFEAAYYTTGTRPAIAEFGRYAFPAIVPLAVLVVASLHAFGRRWALLTGAGLLVAMVSLGYAAQLVTLTGFYA